AMAAAGLDLAVEVIERGQQFQMIRPEGQQGLHYLVDRLLMGLESRCMQSEQLVSCLGQPVVGILLRTRRGILENTICDEPFDIPRDSVTIWTVVVDV